MTAREDGEHGAVVVMVAALLPLFALLLAFAIDTGHWWTHARHLQTQADAAALAGARAVWLPNCDDNRDASDPNSILTNAWRYAGDSSAWTAIGGSGAPYNPQYSNADHVTALVNSRNYASNGGSNFSDSGTPCQTLAANRGFLDLKLTEFDLPNLFGSIPGFGSVTINKHARVEIRSVAAMAGALPIAVPDPSPLSAIVTFVDKSTGLPLGGCTSNGTNLSNCTVPLGKTGFNDTLNLNVWDNDGAPVTLPVTTIGVGVRIALAGVTLCPSGVCTNESAAQSSPTCSRYLVECYELDSDVSPLNIRGYKDPDAAFDPPGNVQLIPGNCSDPYFSSDLVPCSSVILGAHINTGGRTSATEVTITASPGGVMTWQGGDYWTSTPISISAGSGLNSFSINWSTTTGSVNGVQCGNGHGHNPDPCAGTFPNVQWTYAAVPGGDSDTGPIKSASVWEGGTQWANSLNAAGGGMHALVVRLGLIATLQNAASASDPAVALRLAKTSSGGSQTQAVDCDPDYPNLKEEIANGCRPRYRKDIATNEYPTVVDCSQMSWSALQNTEQPWPCVGVQTGVAASQVPDGMTQRVLAGGICSQHPNNWDSLWATKPPVDITSDTRFVPVFITAFGAFSGTGITGPGGSRTVPVTNFAIFYVTGWSKVNGNGAYCPGDDDPAQFASKKHDAKGYIVGHFVQYLLNLRNAEPTNEFCIPDELGACVAVLTQ
jgi:hypothetical protein